MDKKKFYLKFSGILTLILIIFTAWLLGGGLNAGLAAGAIILIIILSIYIVLISLMGTFLVLGLLPQKQEETTESKTIHRSIHPLLLGFLGLLGLSLSLFIVYVWPSGIFDDIRFAIPGIIGTLLLVISIFSLFSKERTVNNFYITGSGFILSILGILLYSTFHITSIIIGTYGIALLIVSLIKTLIKPLELA